MQKHRTTMGRYTVSLWSRCGFPGLSAGALLQVFSLGDGIHFCSLNCRLHAGDSQIYVFFQWNSNTGSDQAPWYCILGRRDWLREEHMT